MKRPFVTAFCLILIASAFIQGCADAPPEATAPAESAPGSNPTTADGTGTLELRANGEDFIRQGFVSKDGWAIEFDGVYVTLAELTAYQTNPPYDPTADTELQATEQVTVAEPKTIDLAAGDENAEPILIEQVEAPAGQYNALSWKMVPAASGPASGYPLVLQGTATKDGQTVDFTLKMSQELAFRCGEFVGDERKGILEPDANAQLEATFHFDHLFGSAELPADDALNTGALGFEPFAAIATDGKLDADTQTLEQNLAEEDYGKLIEILPSLGHVGEGHCAETQLTT
jgi:hypothetical protein